MVRFCPGVTLHKPIRTDASQLQPSSLIARVGGGYRADTGPHILHLSEQDKQQETCANCQPRTEMQRKNSDLHLPEPGLCSLHVDPVLPPLLTSGLSLPPVPSLLWVTLHQAIHADCWKTYWQHSGGEQKPLKLCLAPAPILLNPYHHPFRIAEMCYQPSAPRTDLRYTVGT